MYSFVYQLYFALKRREKRLREAERKKKALHQKALDYCEWFYNVPVRRWYEKHPSKKYGLNRKPREKKVIVSFTSYPKRIGDVWLVAETLLRQSCKPDKVILWLADSQFPGGLADLPPRLTALQDQISEEKHKAYVGKAVRCLVDGISDDPSYDLTARTPGNRLVRLTGDTSKVGEFCDVKITNANKWSLFGEMV